MKTLIIYNKEGIIVNKVPTEENELFNILCDIPDNKTIKSINNMRAINTITVIIKIIVLYNVLLYSI